MLGEDHIQIKEADSTSPGESDEVECEHQVAVTTPTGVLEPNREAFVVDMMEYMLGRFGHMSVVEFISGCLEECGVEAMTFMRAGIDRNGLPRLGVLLTDHPVHHQVPPGPQNADVPGEESDSFSELSGSDSE